MVIPQAGVVAFMDVCTDNEESLTEAVGMQLLSVAVVANQSAMQLYTSGMLQRDSVIRV